MFVSHAGACNYENNKISQLVFGVRQHVQPVTCSSSPSRFISCFSFFFILNDSP